MSSNFITDLKKHLQKGIDYFNGLSILKKSLAILFAIVFTILPIVILINYMTIVHKMIEVAEEWDNWGIKGALLLFGLIFCVGFPPLIGYSSLCVLTGMVYGLHGWLIVTVGTVLGSSASFALCRYLFYDYSVRLVNRNDRLKLFVSVLNDTQESYLHNLTVLTLIRLCPLPYSLTNCALSIIPGFTFQMFLIASIIASPKSLVHLFIGSQMKQFGEETTSTARLVRFISMAVTGGSVGTASYILYTQLMKKLSEQSYRSIGDDDDDEATERFLMNDNDDQEAEVSFDDSFADDYVESA